MKNLFNKTSLFLAIAFGSLGTQLHAQDKKFIEVTGSAEMTIQPDNILLQISIVGKDQKTLDKAEKELFTLLKNNNINEASIQIESTYMYNWGYWWNYYNDSSKMKTFKVTITPATELKKLARDLHVDWIKSVQMVSSSNSDTQKFRKELKIQAMKAAKEKATYLLESIGEKLGGVISVFEIPEGSHSPYYYGNINSNTVVSSSYRDDTIENSQEIRLRYEVKVTFEIK